MNREQFGQECTSNRPQACGTEPAVRRLAVKERAEGGTRLDLGLSRERMLSCPKPWEKKSEDLQGHGRHGMLAFVRARPGFYGNRYPSPIGPSVSRGGPFISRVKKPLQGQLVAGETLRKPCTAQGSAAGRRRALPWCPLTRTSPWRAILRAAKRGAKPSPPRTSSATHCGSEAPENLNRE